MEELLSFQNNLLKEVSNSWNRYLYPELNKKERLIGIKGLRGVGKTTMLLQHLTFDFAKKDEGLYVTADHPYFYNNSLFDAAGQFYKYGGKLMLIDEVHKYKNWSRELKLIYDGYPDLKTIFTSSSALDLYRGESDLSRRLYLINLHGLSFREFLSFKYQLNFEKITLKELLADHQQYASQITHSTKILPLFKEYLYEGYFPFSKDIHPGTMHSKLLQIVNTVIESDLAFIEEYSADHTYKIKKLLGVIAESVPFEPNISKIASKLGLGRNTVNVFLKNLDNAGILKLLSKSAHGLSRLQKPDKIFFENPNFVYAFKSSPDIGTLRETFFMNQVKNAGYPLQISMIKGDFLVDEKLTFEIGGKSKGKSQLQNLNNAYLVKDDIETAYGKSIPLWLFGFLY